MERMGTAEDSVAAEVMARNEMRKCCMVEGWLMYEYMESNNWDGRKWDKT